MTTTSDPAPRDAHAPEPVAGGEYALLVALLAAGAAIRAYGVGRAPGFWYDEAIYALDGLSVLREPGWPIFFTTGGHMREPLFMYLLAATFAVFEPTIQAARGLSAAIGTVTIAAVWLMARQWFGRPTALVAAFVTTFLFWHVTFSSLCFRTIQAPLFAALLAYCASKAARPPHAWPWVVAAGVVLGLGAYTYLAWRLAPVIVVAVLGFAWWCRRQQGDFPFRPSALALGIALLVASPLLAHFAFNPDHFRGRTSEVTLTGRDTSPIGLILRQARDVALSPLLRGDHVGKHNLPGGPDFIQTRLFSLPGPVEAARWSDARANGTAPDPHGTGLPVFDAVFGVLFYLCAVRALVLAGRGSIPHGALLIWLAVGSLASVLSFGAPNLLRLTYLIPAMVVLLSEGLVGLATSARGRGVPAAAVLAVGALLVAHFAFVNLRRLHAWPTHPMVRAEFNVDLAQLGSAIRRLPASTPVVVSPVLRNLPTLRFAAGDRRLIDASETAGLTRWVEARTLPPWPPMVLSGSPVAPARGEQPLERVLLGERPMADLVLVEPASRR